MLKFLEQFKSLKMRLAILAIVPCILMIILNSTSFLSIKLISSSLSDLKNNKIPLIETSNNMSSQLNGILGKSFKISQADVDAFAHDDFDNVKKNFDSFKTALKKYLILSKSKKEIELFKPVLENWGTIEPIYESIFNQVTKIDFKSKDQKDKFLNKIRNVLGLLVSSFDNISNAFLIIEKNRSDEMAMSLNKNDNSARQANLISLTVGIAGVLITLFFGFYISFVTKKSMTNISLELQQESFLVNKASDQVVEASSQLSDMTTNQSSALEQISQELQEISTTVHHNSDASIEAQKISIINRGEAEKGRVSVSKMLDAINDIDKSNQEFSEKIFLSNKKFQEMTVIITEIGNKTKIIDDIVFQTKLLSFNASVEAARAGEAGKGFSVVAEEVGNLAQMSGKAASEIKQLLDESVQKVDQVIKESQDIVQKLSLISKEKISNGSIIAGECRIAFEDILGNVLRVDELITKIALSSKEQSNGVDEVSKAVFTISDGLSQNSQVATDSTSIAGDLKIQAQALDEIIRKLIFILDGKNILV